MTWREEFDKADWMNFGGDQWCGCSMKDEQLKDFIQSLLDKQRKEVAEGIIGDIPENVGITINGEPVDKANIELQGIKSQLREKWGNQTLT